VPRSGTLTGKTNEHVYIETTVQGRRGDVPGRAFQPFELRVSGGRVVRLKFRFSAAKSQPDCGGFNQRFDKRVSVRVSPSGRFAYTLLWNHTPNLTGAHVTGRFVTPTKAEGTLQMTVNETGINPCPLPVRKWSAQLR
jgi:hypothetical protein